MNFGLRKIILTILLFLGIVLFVSYLLPLVFPFLLGTGLALSAEPIVRVLHDRLGLRRGVAAGIGVTMAFFLIALVILVLCGLLIRELGVLAGVLPDLESTVRSGMDSLSRWLLGLIDRAPAGIRTLLSRSVTDFFSSSSALLDRVTSFLLRLASGFLSHVPDSALTLGTAVISSFMISAKLPQLKASVKAKLPLKKIEPLLAGLRRMKTALGGWLKAQLKLSAVTCGVTLAGYWLLGISHAPLWAILTALVDSFPILGTGTVLVPWSLVSFLHGDHIQAFGLLGIYAAAALTRSVLEPRLVGKQLGLDPLATLAALYVGYKLFGLGGMILAPMVTAAALQLMQPQADDKI